MVDLEKDYPHLFKEWDYEKNLELLGLNPMDALYISTATKVWWKCEKTCKFGCEHSYETRLKDRSKKKNPQGCPFPGCCHTSAKFCYHESLTYLFPNLVSEWDYEKNKNLTDQWGDIKNTPEDYRPGSNKKVFWKCKKNCDDCNEPHTWDAIINDRTNKSYSTGCPFCQNKNIRPHCFQSSLAGKRSDLAEEWCVEKNIITDRDEDIMKQLNKEIGDEITPGDFLPNSGRIVWWECNNISECGCPHEWRTAIINRNSGGTGCPFCSDPPKKVCLHYSLAQIRSDLLNEWNYEKNNKLNLNPEKLSVLSHKYAHWICSENHKYFSQIRSRTRKIQPTGCPDCSKRKTETKLFIWLEENYSGINIASQIRFDWCRSEINHKSLPFDFVIEDYKLILELDGRQHFEQVMNWKSPELQQKTDKFKMKKALENEYSVIRILQEDVLYDQNNWYEKLREAIKKYETPQIIYVDSSGEYDVYKN